VGAVCAEAAALSFAARRGGEHGAAYLPASHRPKPTGRPGAANVDKAALHIGAVAFFHRFGSSLNEHVHFHVCVVDGVFEAVADSVIFHLVSGIYEAAVAQAQATLRAFVRRGLLESFEAKEMLAYQHSGFSVDAGVCIAAHDRAALERLLRYCARPPFACERLRKEGATLVYPRHVGHPCGIDCAAQVGEGADGEPNWDMAAQPAPDCEVDQRVNW
jgi:hypothetical protein